MAHNRVVVATTNRLQTTPTALVLHAESVVPYVSALSERWALRFASRLEDVGDARPSLVVANVRPRGASILDLGDALPARFPDGWLAVVHGKDEGRARACLEAGAHDLLFAPPLDARELGAKAERIRRAADRARVVLDPTRMVVHVGDETSEALTAREFQILAVLLSAGDPGIARAEAHRRVWRDVRVGPRTIDVHLSHLRHKLLPLGLWIGSSGGGRVRLLGLGEPSGTGSPSPRRMHRPARPSLVRSARGA